MVASTLMNGLLINSCFALLFVAASVQQERGDSFAIHLVHPYNAAIVSSPNKDVDLSGYQKVVVQRAGRVEELWINNNVELDLSDLEKASVTMPPKLEFSRKDLEYLQKIHPGLELGEPEPMISLSFTPEGGKRFAEFSSRNVKRRTVIILDGRVLSDPVILEPILDGTMQLTADEFSKQEKQNIVNRINELIDRYRKQ